jgi:hypothetical protein
MARAMSRALHASWALFLTTSLVGCGPTTTAPQHVTTVVDRPGRPWPSETPPCTIPYPPDASPSCVGAIAISSDAGGASPIAVIEEPAEVEFAWRDLPVLGGGDRARVDVFSPFLVSGWASLADAPFSLTEDVAIRPRHVVAAAGTRVAVLGTTGDKVVVRVPTAFKAPEAVEIAVACRSVRNGRSKQSGARAPRGSGFLIARDGAPLELRESPEGPALLVFQPRPDQVFRSIEQRGEALRIAGGAGLGARHPDSETLLFDGWADVRRFYQAPEALLDRSASHCVPDRDDVDPASVGRVRREAMLNIGAEPPGRHFATLRNGATVHIDEDLGEFVSVTFTDDAIRPPRGQRYFARRAEIDIE